MSEVQIPAASPAAIRLFACMSRFEFALKEVGFVTGAEDGPVGVGWTAFEAEAVRAGAFDHIRGIAAVRPLFDEPPRKQLRKGDGFEWGDPLPVRNIQEVSTAVRQIRNNLFHGGKAGADPRDDALCEAATAALLFLLGINPRVNAAFVGEY